MERNYTSECYGSCSSRFGLDGNKFEILDESPGKVPNLELTTTFIENIYWNYDYYDNLS